MQLDKDNKIPKRKRKEIKEKEIINQVNNIKENKGKMSKRRKKVVTLELVYNKGKKIISKSVARTKITCFLLKKVKPLP